MQRLPMKSNTLPPPCIDSLLRRVSTTTIDLEESMMEKYVELEMEVIAFDSEDVITTSDKGNPTLPEIPIGG